MVQTGIEIAAHPALLAIPYPTHDSNVRFKCYCVLHVGTLQFFWMGLIEFRYLAWVHMALTVGAIAAAIAGVSGGSKEPSGKHASTKKVRLTSAHAAHTGYSGIHL